jgi:hypothetical protein
MNDAVKEKNGRAKLYAGAIQHHVRQSQMNTHGNPNGE